MVDVDSLEGQDESSNIGGKMYVVLIIFVDCVILVSKNYYFYMDGYAAGYVCDLLRVMRNFVPL